MNVIERMKSLVEVGAFGSITISAIGDFLAPKGGWMLTLAAGAIGLALLAYACLCPPERNRLRKFTEGGEKPSTWWDGRRWRQHGVHVLAIFTAVCLLVGTKSHASAARGGILGSSFPAVADVQGTVGLLQRSIAEQHKTQAGIAHLAEIVKKETSADPRKELANLGVPWDGEKFFDAIRNGDAETVKLFLEGGMPVRYVHELDGFLGPSNNGLLSLFEAHPPRVLTAVPCLNLIDFFGEDGVDLGYLEKLAADDRATGALREACGPYSADLSAKLQKDIAAWSDTSNIQATPQGLERQKRYQAGRVAKLRVIKKIMKL